MEAFVNRDSTTERRGVKEVPRTKQSSKNLLFNPQPRQVTHLPTDSAFKDQHGAGGSVSSYWKYRTAKLSEQAPDAVSQIFAGLTFYFNGRSGEKQTMHLKGAVSKHGGRTTPFFSVRGVTHIIAENLSGMKTHKAMKSVKMKVVHPDWLTRCMAEGRLLPDAPFRVVKSQKLGMDNFFASKYSSSSSCPSSLFCSGNDKGDEVKQTGERQQQQQQQRRRLKREGESGREGGIREGRVERGRNGRLLTLGAIEATSGAAEIFVRGEAGGKRAGLAVAAATLSNRGADRRRPRDARVKASDHGGSHNNGRLKENTGSSRDGGVDGTSVPGGGRSCGGHASGGYSPLGGGGGMLSSALIDISGSDARSSGGSSSGSGRVNNGVKRGREEDTAPPPQQLVGSVCSSGRAASAAGSPVSRRRARGERSWSLRPHERRDIC